MEPESKELISLSRKLFIEETDHELPEHVRTRDMRYTDFKVFAHGGVCLIQSCKDNYLGRIVCHKSLRKEFVNSKEERIRFLREARVTAMLQHPNTIPVYDISRDNMGRYFFTMKLLHGHTLHSIFENLKQNNQEIAQEFKLNRMLGAYIQIANALDYAHEHGVIHRDIKPMNIAIGAYGEVHLIDWGLAKVGHKSDEEADIEVKKESLSPLSDFRLTRAGELKATPLYMSPEQVNRDRNLDARSDIYSLGTVLYEILTLENMVEGKTVQEVMDNINNARFIPPSKRKPERKVPPELEEICLKCVELDPNNRYQKVSELINDIRKFREDSLDV
ncbi:MAG TPA: serine/threonine protein kinase [Leptospiraceae bacterium]|nr:protein kinase [Spirochaetaceae bacterium]HBS06996.1 serine/threonine protein kinase [Leptospiraceae bacterium]|tara:strand:- start:12986 stop:13984 length:999 start_codon:yes stop_codon:yes gene_type:complete